MATRTWLSVLTSILTRIAAAERWRFSDSR
jgi:hypothetical protein